MHASAPMSGQLSIERLLDEDMHEGETLAADAPLLDDSCLQGGIQSGEHLKFALPTRREEHLQIELLAEQAGEAQQLLRFEGQPPHPFVDDRPNAARYIQLLDLR